jgi:hypothetical protein
MSKTNLVPVERIARAILLLRGQRVLLDTDLAMLYGVETKALNRAVKRNLARFPPDFMFQLTQSEADALRCQFGTSKTAAGGDLPPSTGTGATRGRGGRRYPPYAFTEQGVAMLSSVLRSPRAVRVNHCRARAITVEIPAARISITSRILPREQVPEISGRSRVGDASMDQREGEADLVESGGSLPSSVTARLQALPCVRRHP